MLRNRLVEVINEHYGDFVSLSSKLVNVDSAVVRMQKPLLEIKVQRFTPSPHTISSFAYDKHIILTLLCV